MENNWKVVFHASGMIHAEIITGRLKSEGIPSKLEYEAIGRIYALTLNGLGEVKVLVPDEYVQKARQVLSDHYPDEDIPWESEENRS